ncbi:MAG: DUF4974 domain-containing protein [Burkholderiales bacterium]|nr:MAG: DUF4974 domain-containing protein [Burkholderiales bacterium]
MVSPTRISAFASTGREAVHEQAARWHMRTLQDSSDHTQRELEGWLAEDDAHFEAWLAANQIWGDIAPAIALAPPAASEKPRNRSFWRAAVPTAAIAAAALFGTGLYIDPFTPTYATGIGEQRVAKLDDGTNIILNTNSMLKTRFKESRRNVDLLRGEVLFNVAHDMSRPFVVRTPGGDVAAIGTSFVVRLEEARVEVILLSGLVDVRQNGNGAPRVVSLQPGERLRSARATQNVDRPEIETVTAWRKGEIILDETSLVDAVTEINRYMKTPIVLRSSSAAQRRISGIVRIDDIGMFVDMVADLYHLDVARSDNAIVLSGEAIQQLR